MVVDTGTSPAIRRDHGFPDNVAHIHGDDSYDQGVAKIGCFGIRP